MHQKEVQPWPAAPVHPRGADRSYARAERIGFGALMIGAPILMLGAAFFHPPHGIESGAQYYSASHDHGTRFYVAHTLFFLSAVLFVPAVVGLARLVHPTHPKAAFWGCVLSLMGFVGYGALDGIDYMTWVAGKADSAVSSAFMAAFGHPSACAAVVRVPRLLWDRRRPGRSARRAERLVVLFWRRAVRW
ncbi:hypothetical protein [Streptomyces sp. NPDC054961]